MDTFWERFVAFGQDRRHRAGGPAFQEAAQEQEELAGLPTGQRKARTNVRPTTQHALQHHQPFPQPFKKGAPMADENLQAELERLRAENAALKSRATSEIIRVSDKGGVSVYGLGRFPVTLYKEQWLKLLSMADEIRKFIAENEAKLKVKS